MCLFEGLAMLSTRLCFCQSNARIVVYVSNEYGTCLCYPVNAWLVEEKHIYSCVMYHTAADAQKCYDVSPNIFCM